MNKDTDGKWRIRVHRLAQEDFADIRRRDPHAYKQMLKALKRLSGCANLFYTRKPLDICYSFPHAQDCLRYKARGQRWRVVLRLIVDGQVVRPTEMSRPRDGYLQVVFADLRSDVTYSVNLAVRDVTLMRM